MVFCARVAEIPEVEVSVALLLCFSCKYFYG